MARAAAIESGLPNSVPPVATMSDRSPSGPFQLVQDGGDLVPGMPQAPNGTPAAIDLPAVDDVRDRGPTGA